MKNKNAGGPKTFINSKIISTISVSLVLLLLGIVVLLSLFTKNLSSYVKENLAFSVFLTDNLPDSEIRMIQKNISLYPFVKSIKYISKEEAAEELQKELGENPETFLGYNPLQASFEIKLKADYANSDSLSVIERNLKLNSNIQDIDYRKDLLDSLNNNMKTVGIIIVLLSLLLLVISFALINNTIRLMIYSKRFLIHTMKLVGATNSFIRKPFVKSHILSGIVAGLIASGLLLALIYYFSQGVEGFSRLITLDMMGVVFGIILLLGIFISWITSYLAVNKFLRTKGDDLFYI